MHQDIITFLCNCLAILTFLTLLLKYWLRSRAIAYHNQGMMPPHVRLKDHELRHALKTSTNALAEKYSPKKQSKASRPKSPKQDNSKFSSWEGFKTFFNSQSGGSDAYDASALAANGMRRRSSHENSKIAEYGQGGISAFLPNPRAPHCYEEQESPILTSKMRSNIQSLFANELMPWSETYFRYIGKEAFTNLASSLAKTKEAISPEFPPESQGRDIEQGAHPQERHEDYIPFLDSLQAICWHVEDILQQLESNDVSVPDLVQAVAADILIQEVIYRPFSGYNGGSAMASVVKLYGSGSEHLAGETMSGIRMKKILLSTIFSLNTGQTIQNEESRDNYLRSVATQIDSIVAPIAKLDRTYSSESDTDRREKLFRVAKGFDRLSRTWHTRLYDIIPVNKHWIDANRRNGDALLFRAENGLMKTAKSWHESTRFERDDGKTAWPILAVLLPGFVKYEPGETGVMNYSDGEIWCEASVLLGSTAIVTVPNPHQKEEVAGLSGSFTADEENDLLSDSIENTSSGMLPQSLHSNSDMAFGSPSS